MKEKEIVELLKEQNSQGMKQFMIQYGPFIRYIIAPILTNQSDQEDCISEISARVWQKIPLYEEKKGKFLSWLTALSRNTALNYSRKNVKKAEQEELTEDIPSESPTPEEIILQKERQEELMRALQTLPAQERQIFYRKYYYMQSTAQIAREFGTTVRSVEGKLYRIKKHLRKKLGGRYYE